MDSDDDFSLLAEVVLPSTAESVLATRPLDPAPPKAPPIFHRRQDRIALEHHLVCSKMREALVRQRGSDRECAAFDTFAAVVSTVGQGRSLNGRVAKARTMKSKRKLIASRAMMRFRKNQWRPFHAGC